MAKRAFISLKNLSIGMDLTDFIVSFLIHFGIPAIKFFIYGNPGAACTFHGRKLTVWWDNPSTSVNFMKLSLTWRWNLPAHVAFTHCSCFALCSSPLKCGPALCLWRALKFLLLSCGCLKPHYAGFSSLNMGSLFSRLKHRWPVYLLAFETCRWS